MAQALFYSSNAVAMTLAAGIASGDTTCNLSSTSGLPASFPFKLLIGWQTAQQEVVHCTALSGVVATISRGQDGTTAQAHSIGASVVHGVSAREFNDLELHIASSAGVHGLVGSVVGTTDVQALTNKTLDATSTLSGVPLVGTTTAQTLTNKTLTAPTIKPTTSVGVGATVTGLASQSGDLQQWTDSTPTVLAKVNSAGSGQFVSVINTTTGSQMGTSTNLMIPGGTSSPALAARGLSGQTGNLLECQIFGGSAVAKIDVAGNLSATNVTSAWTAYTPTFTNCSGAVGNFSYLQMGKTLFIRGYFSGGTATATAVVKFSLPASLTVTALPIPLAGINGASATTTWTVGSADTTNVTTAIAITTGTALSGMAVAGVIPVN